MVARRRPHRSLADRIINADTLFLRFLLENDDATELLPRDAVVIFDDSRDPELFKEAANVALSNRALTGSKKELSKPPVVAHINGTGVRIERTTWDALAKKVGWERASPTEMDEGSQR
jgi:hypothetical protein